MQSPEDPDRRAFIRRFAGLSGGAALTAYMPAFLATMDLACSPGAEQQPYRLFTAEEAAFVEAFTARIIPTDDRPGAREAGVTRFIDMVLDTMPVFTGADALIRGTMDQLAGQAGQPFASLSEDEQDTLIHGIETELPFQILQFLTVAGFLSHPARGGNRGKVGWQLIGFDDRHAWTPPFGHYDAEVNA
ncbi:MAG: gluconate 2-dehydrogenase subunit 3 family protein [Rhodothermales bacterium]|nr:gluconate 2-dehydrogenase subunit 3 family protein [Rhodothermales bacterium]MBO6778352.1 gluconate 2-dehydrogenase subunit 3 family protein [Rhodothermales bacterium]